MSDDLILETLLRAKSLDYGEALQLGDVMIARSPSTSQLAIAVGHPGADLVWRRGDFEDNVRGEMGCRLDWRKQGYFAHRFERDVRSGLTRPAIRIRGFGRQIVTAA